MKRPLAIALCAVPVVWLLASAFVGCTMLPPMLLNAPLPQRTEAQRAEIRARLCPAGCRWEQATVKGGEGVTLDVWRLHRPQSKGVVLLLHGFGDDAWGTAPMAQSLLDWDVVCFTFRGRDLHPEIPCTLGAWERRDVVAVVEHLESQGALRSRMLVVAASQGAGVALLALSDLEKNGGPLAGALLECPYENVYEAAKNHVKLAMGPLELLARPAERIGLHEAGQRAHFDPATISPAKAAAELRTPMALLTGDADRETPLSGVRNIAKNHPDLTVVPGAGHCQAGSRIPGGWKAWAETRLNRWGLN